MSESKYQYLIDYKKKTVERTVIEVPKGKRQLIKDTASANNLSINRLFISAVEEKYGIDLTTKGG